jgi:DNA-binding NarL/FixJ family response regulator
LVAIATSQVDRIAPELTGPGGLSPRELDVLRLVSAGRTDQQIADELFIARRTVTSHVTSILNKLGVDTRTGASALAIRRGWV